MIRSFINRRRRWAIALGVAAVLAVGGTALAAWMLSGSGQAGGQVGTPTNLTAVAVTPSAAVYPSGLGDAALDVTNPNSFPATVTGVDLSGAVTGSGCSAGDVTLAQSAFTGLAVTIPAGGHSIITLPGAFQGADDMSASCEGVSISVAANLTARSGN